MQTGIFYVRLKAELDLKEQQVSHGGRMVFLAEILAKNKIYPVLAVEYLDSANAARTIYHVPLDSNEIAWLPADLFVFARD